MASEVHEYIHDKEAYLTPCNIPPTSSCTRAFCVVCVQMNPDTVSSITGLAFALPILLSDALIMLPDWSSNSAGGDEKAKKEEESDSGDEVAGAAEPGEEKDSTTGGGWLGSLTTRWSAIKTALDRYQREESLMNPARALPWYVDCGVASVSRLTDEMLERAVFLGFVSSWLADRAVEAGMAPYEAEEPSKYAACAIAYLFLEARLQVRSRRTQMRAFRVQRNKITGKAKLKAINTEEAARLASEPGVAGVQLGEGGSKGAVNLASAAGRDPVNAVMFNAGVKKTLDGARSRLLLLLQALCYTASGNLWAPFLGGVLTDLAMVGHQRRTLRRFIETMELPEELFDPMDTGKAPTEDAVRFAQMRSLRKDLAARRQGQNMDFMAKVNAAAVEAEADVELDPALAAAAAEARALNVLMQDVVREVQSVRGFEDQGRAVTEVLDALHKTLPPQELALLPREQAAQKMSAALADVRAELLGTDTATETAPAEREAEPAEATAGETAAKAEPRAEMEAEKVAAEAVDLSSLVPGGTMDMDIDVEEIVAAAQEAAGNPVPQEESGAGGSSAESADGGAQSAAAAAEDGASTEGEGDEGSKSVEKAKNSTIAALERLLGEDSSEEN